MHRAVGVPNLDEYADPHVLVELAVGAERSGWDGFFIWDHLVPEDQSTPGADPQIALAAIAAATARVKLGALVTPLPRRRPHKVAKEAATLQQLARGRLIFGAAIGWSRELEYEAFGEDGGARGDKLDEGLQVVSRLLAGETVDFAGEHYTVRGIRFAPTARGPIWIGGGGPAKRPFPPAPQWGGGMPSIPGAGHAGTVGPEPPGASAAP